MTSASNIWQQMKVMLGELEEYGLEIKSPEGAETIHRLLEVPVSGKFCKFCRKGPLRRFEVLNQERCEECRVKAVRVIDEQKAQEQRAQYAR
jgi:hypothetical protein